MERIKYFRSDKAITSIRYYVSVVAVISPLLAMYGAKISKITVLDVAVGIAAVLILLSGQIKELFSIHGQDKWIWGAILLIVLNYLLNISSYPGSMKVSILLRCIRYTTYLGFCIILMHDSFFDAQLALKVYRFVTVFAACYLLVQYVLLYGFHYSLPGYLPWLPLMRPELASFTESLGATFSARPRSIFAEPSQFGIYVTGYLLLSVLYNRREKDWFEKVVTLTSMSLSASSTALLGLGLVALIYAVRLYRKHKKQVLRRGAILLCLCILVFALSSFVRDRVLYLITRLPTSFYNRVAGFVEYGQRIKDFSLAQILLGIGMDLRDMTVWYSGLIKILLFFGVFGLAFLCAFTVNTMKHGKPKQRLYIATFMLLSVFSEILVSNWLILFLPFVFRDLEQYSEN